MTDRHRTDTSPDALADALLEDAMQEWRRTAGPRPRRRLPMSPPYFRGLPAELWQAALAPRRSR
jgi:hypothetical protein